MVFLQHGCCVCEAVCLFSWKGRWGREAKRVFQLIEKINSSGSDWFLIKSNCKPIKKLKTIKQQTMGEYRKLLSINQYETNCRGCFRVQFSFKETRLLAATVCLNLLWLLKLTIIMDNVWGSAEKFISWPRYSCGMWLDEVYFSSVSLVVRTFLPSTLQCLDPIGQNLFSSPLYIKPLRWINWKIF